nr:hypothetical protein [Tanacetum cinerariifolium]
MEECHLMLTNQIDLVNPEGNRVVPDVSKPLPLGGPPGDTARMATLSISKLKAANYPKCGLEELVPSLWIESEHDYNVSAAYGITHWGLSERISTSLDTMPHLIVEQSNLTCEFLAS